MPVRIAAKPLSSRQLATALGVPDSRYRKIVEMVDAPGSKAQPKRTVKTKILRVSPYSKGWKLKTAANGTKSQEFATKAEAVAAAKSLARSAGAAQLIIHRQDGGVQTTLRYGSKTR